MANDSTSNNSSFSLVFNGTSDCIELPAAASLDLTSDGFASFTIEAWIAPATKYGSVSYPTVFGVGYWGITLSLNAAQPKIESWTNNGNRIESTQTIPVEKWSHIALVYSRNQFRKFYINGQEVGSGSAPAFDLKQYGNAIAIGGGGKPDARAYFTGKISEVRLWNCIRTAEQLQAQMHCRLTGNEPELVGYWPLNEGSGTTANDKTANSNKGTIVGATWEAGSPDLVLAKTSPATVQKKLLPVLTFNGKDDYVATTLDTQPSALPATTWEVWVKPDRDAWRWDMILCTDDGGWDRFVAENKGDFYVSHGSNAWKVVAADIDRWQHIAVVYTPENGIKFYKNGTEYIYSGETTFGTTGQTLFFGSSPVNGNQRFQGSICEVRVWNYVREPSEIQRDMHHRLTGNEPGLVGYWPLTEGSGNTVSDKAIGQNHGTIHSATWETSDVPITDKTLRSTGLEDYGYWYRWKQSLPANSSPKKSFRRGRIWA